jgi:hypothetical protein
MPDYDKPIPTPQIRKIPKFADRLLELHPRVRIRRLIVGHYFDFAVEYPPEHPNHKLAVAELKEIREIYRDLLSEVDRTATYELWESASRVANCRRKLPFESWIDRNRRILSFQDSRYHNPRNLAPERSGSDLTNL